jgi:hypothetical protein
MTWPRCSDAVICYPCTRSERVHGHRKASSHLKKGASNSYVHCQSTARTFHLQQHDRHTHAGVDYTPTKSKLWHCQWQSMFTATSEVCPIGRQLCTRSLLPRRSVTSNIDQRTLDSIRHAIDTPISVSLTRLFKLH